MKFVRFGYVQKLFVLALLLVSVGSFAQPAAADFGVFSDISGDVVFNGDHQAPDSNLGTDSTIDFNEMKLWRESNSIDIPAGLTGLNGPIPAGKYTSFIVHRNASSVLSPATSAELSTFTYRPIFDVIVSTDELIASDQYFGHPGTTYSTDPAEERGIEATWDTVAISEDRLTVSITLSGRFGLHQARILVRSDEDQDGYLASVDCDDTNQEVYPDAIEQLDGLDNDCDGVSDERPNGAPSASQDLISSTSLQGNPFEATGTPVDLSKLSYDPDHGRNVAGLNGWPAFVWE